MASDETKFAEMFGESREDEIEIITNLFTTAADELTDVASKLIKVNKEKPLTLEEMEKFAEEAVKVRAAWKLIKTIVTERYIPAVIQENKEQRRREQEGY